MEPVDWSGGHPRSPRFGDVYFQEDGLAESRAVFLAGCGLPQAWAGRRRFTLAELGFGTGLNVLALLQLWAQARPSPEARLSIFSVEGFPMPRADAARALARWPELAELAAPLLAAWPDGRRGRRRIAWPGLGAMLDLAVEEALPAVQGWDGGADAWFLDGFAPAANPAMWAPGLLGAAAARTAPGGRLASFTVAGAVRRALADAGLQVDKRPGHGRKRERLEARAPGAPPRAGSAPRVAVVGGGVAAAALMRAFQAEGLAPLRIDAAAPSPASGNAAALVAPRLDAGLGLAARLHAEAFARATALYAQLPGAVIARGALQLARRPQDEDRFARLAAWGGFAPGRLHPLAPDLAATRLAEAAAPAALQIDDALVVEPAAVLRAWLGEAPLLPGQVAAIAREHGETVLRDPEGSVLHRCDAAVLACGAGLAALLPELDLRPTRGQASEA
ncbi:MAG: tRNA (5-methylaminomethyl-2-thiouridine)(34)-methyltransferase MnmD, partial [Caulobacteraceae bacterium]|nr:tRNA (5-methylaminomethyl-2-thiouridine)(34)-methyltransferase MnmD [Caulobacter sp.]